MVSQLKKNIGMKDIFDDSPDLIDYEIAEAINNKTIFSPESEKMYYYAREGF